ncbi:MAG TPA: OmpA family protein [Chthoniobacteraceae bacterium]|jgi:outer membrane protein OmpA-like peptidoglycan-associated protein|nr:OmpA family protein [Chthoniobacteraceae bacterium]
MSRLGKCQNYSGCLLAYRGEQADVPEGQPFVCAECGKPLEVVKPPAGAWLRIAGIAALVLALVVGAIIALPMLTKKKGSTTQSTPTPAPNTTEPRNTTAAVGAGNTGATPLAVEAAEGAENDKPVAPATIDLDPNKAANREIKLAVLDRIDWMPNVTQPNKDKLYASVERARKMGLVLTIPFGKGKSTLGPADIQALKTEMEKPGLTELRNDPTAVFVVLGYADPKGDAKANLAYSQSRADSVVSAMKKECGVANVTHAVAMGGSTLLDAQNMEKNRTAEVWVVLP